MQEADKSIFLVFALVIIFNSTLANLLCNIKSTIETLFLWAFFQTTIVYIDMYG